MHWKHFAPPCILPQAAAQRRQPSTHHRHTFALPSQRRSRFQVFFFIQVGTTEQLSDRVSVFVLNHKNLYQNYKYILKILLLLKTSLKEPYKKEHSNNYLDSNDPLIFSGPIRKSSTLQTITTEPSSIL